MEKTEWFQKAVQSIMDTDEDAAKDIATKSLEAGVDPLEMINQGFTEGIRKMGGLFERGEVFLPGLIVASEAMTGAVEILEAALPAEQQAAKKAIEDIDRSGRWPQALVTEVQEALPFWPAEEYHQRYLEKHGYGACSI